MELDRSKKSPFPLTARYTAELTQEEALQMLISRYEIPNGYQMAHYWGLPAHLNNYEVTNHLVERLDIGDLVPTYSFQFFQNFEEEYKQYLHHQPNKNYDTGAGTFFLWVSENSYTNQIILWQHLRQIQHPMLKEFICSVFSDPTLMLNFYKAKASQSFHHKSPGELFLHSLEVALTASHLAALHGLNVYSQEVALVGGLIHDFGKINVFYNKPEANLNVSHEAFNF